MCLGCKWCKWEECTNEEVTEEVWEKIEETDKCPYFVEYFPEHPDQYWREDI